MMMKILIGCEESGKVREAFRKLGHDAYSCDLLPSRDNSPYHIQDDIFEGIMGSKKGWDIIILHPPCTSLAVSGNRWYGRGTPGYFKRLAAMEWTHYLWMQARLYARIGVALENPVGVLSTLIGPPTQYIQPWQFGHGETKKTGLWLSNLPPLTPTDVVDGRDQRVWKMGPSKDRAMLRSETYQGWADAMASQWGK